MHVKTFEASTMQDAFRKVKKSFGKDAVILGSEETTFETTGQKGYRVRAAVGQAYDDQFSEHVSSQILDELKDLKQLLIEKSSIFEELQAIKRQGISLNRIEEANLEVRNLLTLDCQNRFAKQNSVENQSIANILSSLDAKGVFAEDLHDLQVILEDYLDQEILKESLHTPTENITSEFEILQAVCLRWVLGHIQIYRDIKKHEDGSNIHCYVGPHGVGKSKLIGKLAQSVSQEHPGKVIVYSLETSFERSCDKLSTFCKINQIPFKPVSDVKAIEKDLNDSLKQKRFMLLDTPGVSPKTISHISELEAKLSGILPVEKHLVLDTKNKTSFQDRCVQSFASLGLASFCFSKLDESWTHGEIFSFSKKWQLPLHLLSHGDSYINTLEAASAERIIDRLFKLQ